MTIQRWQLEHGGRTHRVEADGSARHRVRWYVDDDLVAEKAAMEDKFRLRPDDRDELGGLFVRFSGLGAPRRATLIPPGDAFEAQLASGLGGTDLVPEEGSPAAIHEQKVLAHPTRYTVIQTAGGVAAVVVPLLVAALLARLAFSLDWPDIPWPDLPAIPWPDIPWPDVPRIDLPAIPLPDWSLPQWVRDALGYVKYVWPVVLAFVIARAEVARRRRHQEQQDSRAQQQDGKKEDVSDPEGRTQGPAS